MYTLSYIDIVLIHSLNYCPARVQHAIYIALKQYNARGPQAPRELVQYMAIASIPGRVFAFITVRRTTRPGTSCLRMHQSFVRF